MTPTALRVSTHPAPRPPQNDLMYFRLRTKELEIMVAPGDDFMVVVIQRWTPVDLAT